LYIINAIPANALSHLANSEGRSLYFKFSPFFVLQLTSLLLLVIELIRRKGKVAFSLSIGLLLASILMSLISVFYTQQFPQYSFVIVISSLSTLAWAILMRTMLTEQSASEQLKLLKSFLLVFIIMTMLEVGISFGQFVTRSTLNLRIEQSTVIPTFGVGADEDGTQFRPIGLKTHANELANSLLISLFSILFLFLYIEKTKSALPWLFKVFVISSILVILLITQSRAAYIGLFLSGVFFFLRERAVSLQLLSQCRDKLKPYILVLIIAALLFVPLVTRRLLYSFSSFGSGGGYSTRTELQEVAVLLLQKDYSWGVGPGMFIPAAFKDNPNGVMKYFPESVHNGFLLFATEHGLISSLFLLLFIVQFLKEIVANVVRPQNSLILAGLLALCCMMLLHPFEDTLSLLTYITLIVMSIRQKSLADAKK